ncbi:hypothetical protein AGMMS49949_06050 [Alphaproteobacteria bacterium]|nr:hypothetical protein AGMMS49949_06050 [Alphaproteobacteria bacterium]GHS97868.1 hypothetical protein AGMMS50296_5160 [Alphaproteobacteria bacterium]
MPIGQYRYIECGGVSIPIVDKEDKNESETTGRALPAWMMKIDHGPVTNSSISGADGGTTFADYTELHGLQYTLSRNVKGDAALNLYTSGTLWHSGVFVVVQNGPHNSYINNSVVDGTITPNIIILRTIRINNLTLVKQELVFTNCHWAGVYSHSEFTVFQFTACRRSNTVKGITQDGLEKGQASCITDYAEVSVT